MKKPLIVALCLCVPFFAFSQFQKYDLSTYKLPNIKTRLLNFEGYFTGSQNSYQKYINPTEPIPESWTYNNQLKGDGKVSYSQFINNENYQGSLNATASLLYSIF
ncbi:MAG: hypothetical protein HN352_06220 [Bacteroidetes bacterium]|jgi:hypothetical protein|nr:hypothetical protein [Bacteroidota bacterium]MBT3748687.1 hypothetical protein [Bacteroidota bacterium]MBT4399588.1 hypothetical protein [Bacteroidota bacterium]MBT4409307.1 hypothetical protein [Bacteroidota bacterium]MBT7093682.1 hypothetical protein [Bacteroidota bacterium]